MRTGIPNLYYSALKKTHISRSEISTLVMKWSWPKTSHAVLSKYIKHKKSASSQMDEALDFYTVSRQTLIITCLHNLGYVT